MSLDTADPYTEVDRGLSSAGSLGNTEPLGLTERRGAAPIHP